MAEKNNSYYVAVGRRKTSVACVKLSVGKGEFLVNGRSITDYFNRVSHPSFYNKPLELTDTVGSVSVEAKISGGGLESQLGAYVHGVARALLKLNPEFRSKLKPMGLLTRDSRMKESRKYGKAGKARKVKSSPKR
jgi:small subunit ribosomal protein S9